MLQTGNNGQAKLLPGLSSDEATTSKVEEPLYSVIRRNGKVVTFNAEKITVALMKAFLAVKGNTAAASTSTRTVVSSLTEQVVKALVRSRPNGGTFHIEDIQDQVELQLMRQGHQDVARAYVLYREKRSQERKSKDAEVFSEYQLVYVDESGTKKTFDSKYFLSILQTACETTLLKSEIKIDFNEILQRTVPNLYDQIDESDIIKALILTVRTFIESEPDYRFVAAGLLNFELQREVLLLSRRKLVAKASIEEEYRKAFISNIHLGVDKGRLHQNLLTFDLEWLSKELNLNLDDNLDYLGLQTLYDRYFIHIDDRRIETPQAFFMRVAMGLAVNEKDKNARAIEFYTVLSSFDFMSSTPTLFNSGTIRPQLSSCYVTTVPDDLDGIYEAIKEDAMLSKFAGGIGNDWTRVRALNSRIKGTNGRSQGVVPFLKVVNDTAVAVNQGGKRKGAICSYLETWHLDIEEFLELRKNTGDDRRRTHDMNTANWIPDLFMQRVIKDEFWTLLSPSSCPDLHDLYGEEFEAAYVRYENLAAEGKIKPSKSIRAVELWRKMLSMLFETGHPWITFKDPCNIRNPQKHVGSIHSSNLCTEITLVNNDNEIAVCNLGSVNLAQHLLEDGSLDREKIARTVKVAMRMLDNVIDVNYYPVKKAFNSNKKHRPVGLGIMGFQDMLYRNKVAYDSPAALALANDSMEAVCYNAYLASSELAEERGPYPSFKGSLWSQGVLPPDSVLVRDSIKEEVLRQGPQLEFSTLYREAACSKPFYDWDKLREKIKTVGMRNSNCVAIAPTATISNIVGVEASIEPCFANISVKSNLSGDFTVVNRYLVQDLKSLKLWDSVMIADIKYFNGVLSKIDRIPESLKALYKTSFEIEPQWLITAGALRQNWIDQAQSLNVYVAEASGPKLDAIYKLAWSLGLKTTYYLRSLGASNAEKSTLNKSELNSVKVDESGPKMCSIDNPDCESCQ